MRIQRAQKRIDAVPLTKPKRVDLNEAQLHLQRKLSELPEGDLSPLWGAILQAYPELLFSLGGGKAGSPEVAKALGVSRATIDKYVYSYLRVVQREGESAAEFQLRKAQVRPTADAYLLQDGNWVLSPRMLIFLVLAPTQVRGDNPELKQLRKTLSESSLLVAGRPAPIHKNSNVTTWKVPDKP